MKKDVILHISGVHTEEVKIDGTEIERAETEITEDTPAEYFFRNGKHYIIYEEVEDGVSGVTKNQIKITGNTKVELRKNGLHATNMVFEKGIQAHTNYQTPFGNIALDIHTTKLDVQESEEYLEVSVEYALEADGAQLSECRLGVLVREKE
jgi:Uncharacterized protein conserved in bacteria